MVDAFTNFFSDSSLEKIVEGAREKKVLEIMYIDKQQNITTREVEPYEIKNGKLYAYCQKRGGIRAFDLKKIQGVLLTNKSFNPQFPIKIEQSHLQYLAEIQ